MHPILFHIGSFPVRSYGVILMIGVLVALWFARKRAPKFGVSPDDLLDSLFWMVIPGILGARLVYIAQNFKEMAAQGQLFTLQFNGLTSFGGMIFGFIGLLAYAKFKKKPLMPMLDTVGVPVLVAHAIGRIACLLNGCCFGWPGEAWYCVPVEGLHGHYLPAQLLDTIMCLVFAGILMLIERRKWANGVSFSFTIIAYGVSRFIYEFWRAGKEVNGKWVADSMGSLPITRAQFTAIILVIIGLALYYFCTRKKPLPEVVQVEPSPEAVG